jgi:AcrR family transcriptional regulator
MRKEKPGKRRETRRAGSSVPVPSREIADAARAAFDATQRRLIAQAACRVIDRDGLPRTSLRRIAAELDCSLGLIQHHFANKEEVLVAALLAALAQLREDVEARQPLTSDIKGLRDAFVESLRARTADSLYWRVVIAYRGAALSSERLRKALRDHAPEELEFIQSCIASELGADVDDPHVRLMADGITASLDGLATAAVLDPDTYSPERVGRMLDGLVNGVHASEPESSASGSRTPGEARTRSPRS